MIKTDYIEELVKQSKNGNKESFSQLIVLIQSDLYRIAMSRLGDENNVQDAIQNTILSAYININQLRNNKYFKTWITRILINECNRLYKNSKKDSVILEKYSNTIKEDSDLTLDFDSIVGILDEKSKKIFELYYKDELTIKEISKKLNINQNTIKSELSRGRNKIKKSFKNVSIIILILCLFITTSVIAISIIGYIKDLFETNSIGAKNDGLLMAIENLDWYQQIDMQYIDLGNGYKIKFDYLSLDEMNLYLVLEFESETDISKFNNISLNDLKITNENNEVICDRKNVLSDQAKRTIGDKLIENDSHHMQSLIYMYTDAFPPSKTLNISISEITLYRKKDRCLITTNTNFKIDVSEKFLNGNYISYVSNDNIIKKSIVTNTGFYAIVKTKNINGSKIALLDENNNSYNCYYYTLVSYDESSIPEYLIISNFYDTENKRLRLKISDKEFELIKHN